MKYDVFFSISQTEVEGYMPSTKQMWENFLDQVILADSLGFKTAWVAETHLSCQTQKKTSFSVVPEFKGEIGLNTDILQLAPLIFSKTKNINVGSAIRNILCNGGPVAHAEALSSYRALQPYTHYHNRLLEWGFAAGRFDFSNAPYGVFPRNEWEMAFWHVVKSCALQEASEIFFRLLQGEEVSSSSIKSKVLKLENFRTQEDWDKACQLAKRDGQVRDGEIRVKPFFKFEVLSLIPLEGSQEAVQFTVGSHDSKIHELCNQFEPVRVFNLSITPPRVIEDTHLRMKETYHKSGGLWQRWYMPRTAMVFLDDTPTFTEQEKNKVAKDKAQKAWVNYWKAMSGTIDEEKIKQAVDNTIYGSPEQVAEKICNKYHPHDRLMVWFDFNNHDSEDVKRSMEAFMEKVVPLVDSYGRD